MPPLGVLLISTYELGRQPFGLASPAAWLAEAGYTVRCLDLAVSALDEHAVRDADLVALYLPMHTATRLAAALLPRLRRLNPHAHLCCYGLYAPLNAPYLRSLGVSTILGGEFEEGLLALARTLAAHAGAPGPGEQTSLARQRFRVPDRRGLPPPESYARLLLPGALEHTTGYTEATRGCKHLCRHCPIPPVYGGVLRVVGAEIVLEDIARQVAAGARHITFGDPDFFNGPGHALRIVRALHERFPEVTYDVTIKVEHLLKHATLLPVLRETGCLFVTSAVEAVDDRVLAIFAKGHTRADVVAAIDACRAAGVVLTPTFVAFTPWTSAAGYLDLLAFVAEHDLVENVSPVQYGIRLLIPEGSLLLDLAEVRRLAGPFDPAALCYRWQHPDPRMDRLCADVLAAVSAGQAAGEGRPALFHRVWDLAREAAGRDGLTLPESSRQRGRTAAAAPLPHLSEPWYC